MAGDKLHSIKSSADYLGGVSEHTIRAWLSQGKMHPTKVGRRTMIRESELERLINAGEKSKAVQK